MQGFEEKNYYIFSAFLNIVSQGVKPHWHNHIEMLYLISGCGVVTVENDVFEMEQGDFLIVNSGEVHSTCNMRDTRFFVLQFKPSMINPDLTIFSETRYLLPFLQKKLNYEKLIHLSHESSLSMLFNEILDDFNAKYEGYELNIKGNIYKIFSWLIKNSYIALPSLTGVNPQDISRLSALLEYVKDNYRERITDEIASNMACMSYYHFCRIFKKVTGKTFIEYLNYIRLCEAEKLLLTSDKPVSEIAVDVGFSSISYFTRLFKREKGISPMQFRSQKSSKK